MVEPEEAADLARELVRQYIAQAGPEVEHDYLKLLVKLVAVVNNTLLEYTGPVDAWASVNDALDSYAEIWRQAPAPRLH